MLKHIVPTFLVDKLSELIIIIRKNIFAIFVSSLLFFCGVCLLFSFISYNPIDLVETKGKLNIFGIFGANIANTFLQYFGFAAYLLVLFLFRLSFLSFRRCGITLYKTKILTAFASVLFLCFILGSIKKYEFAFFNPLGGYVGFLLSGLITNKAIFFPVFGASCLVFIILFLTAFELLEAPILSHLNFLKKINIFKRSKAEKSENKSSTIIDEHEMMLKARHTGLSSSPAASSSIAKQQPAKDGVRQIFKYVPPAISLLDLNTAENAKKNVRNLSLTKQVEKELQKALEDFGIEAMMKGAKVGPVITMYEIDPKAGIRAARVVGLAEDIARSLKAKSARISLIPSSSSLAVEIPNKERETVFLRELLDSREYIEAGLNIPITLGKSIAGDNIIVDLASMPHLLIAGTTGSGKSVGVNAMILSIIYKLSPHECQFIMIDPKMLELSVYNDIPHLLTPVITESEKAVMALKWLTLEMERRYRRMSSLSVRNIFGYNDAVLKLKNSQQESEAHAHKMPFIVVVIDEMADLMITAGKVIEAYVQRLAQMARAAGIHVIMATQRPSVDVITGIIKANFPTRISYQVSSKIDSRTILGNSGAESLLGKGDMLYMQAGTKTYRIHAPFVSDNEVNNVVSFLKKTYGHLYDSIKVDIFEDVASSDEDIGGEPQGFEGKEGDDLYSEALEIVISENKPSISYIQRRLKIGYNKAANLIERMEKEGVVSKPEPSTGKRIVIKNK